MERKKSTPAVSQNITLCNREQLSITGVIDVESFQDHTILVATELGRLLVKGSHLKVKELSPESTKLSIEGYIHQLIYTQKKKGGGPSWWGGFV